MISSLKVKLGDTANIEDLAHLLYLRLSHVLGLLHLV